MTVCEAEVQSRAPATFGNEVNMGAHFCLIALIGIAGVVLLVWHSNWQVAVGVFLCLWANNLSRQTR